MRRALPPALLLLLAGLAGCAGGDGPAAGPEPEGGSGATSTPVSQTRPTPTGPEDTGHHGVELEGTLHQLGQGYVANVSAYNPGPDSYATARSYTCTSSGHGSWTAKLAGPPGDDLDYRAPGTTELSCAGTTNQPMPPTSWHNWTFSGDWARGSCTTRHVCDNWWDGDLTEEGRRVRAPPGEYTWTFTFRYSKDVGDVRTLHEQSFPIRFHVP